MRTSSSMTLTTDWVSDMRKPKRGAGGGDFVGVGTGLFFCGGVGVGGDEEAGAVIVLVAEIAGEDGAELGQSSFEDLVEEIRLEGGDEEFFEFEIDGVDGAFGPPRVSLGFDECGEGGAFVAEVAGPLGECGLEVSGGVGFSGVEDAAVVEGFVGHSEEAVDEVFVVVGDEGESEEMVVFSHAEALGTEEVGGAGFFELVEDGDGFFGGVVE